MKISGKFICLVSAVIFIISAICPSAFAREFAPPLDASNIGVQTQYKYDENNSSWLRKLVIKEDMLSTSGLINEEILHPVSSYPYTADAPFFKAQVEEYMELYTLDENSQRAAYLYLLNQIGALTVISEPETTDKTKVDWLRSQGIVITEEEANDPEKALMISALYAIMKNDLYYVYSGKTLTIPAGTPMEEALVTYLMALSGDGSELSEFVLKYFHTGKIGNLDDYIYYTSLMSLYVQGYVSPFEIPTITRDEVYRRVAIMTIRSAGIAVDSETATTEEINHKYLCAMLGTQYSVTIDPNAFKKCISNNLVPYYILQRMAYEDANITISQKKYSYNECFDIVLKKTDRFNLKNEFYSDIYEYDIFLDSIRPNISINPTSISTSRASIQINGVNVPGGAYALVELSGKAKETITIVSSHESGKSTETSVYKINVHQGTAPTPDSDLTGIIPDLINPSPDTSADASSQGGLNNALDGVNNALTPVANTILTLNDKGQLVDQYGNIVSDTVYETLPQDYYYVLDDDGNVKVMLSDKKDSQNSDDEGSEGLTEEEKNKLIIGISLAVFIALLLAIIIVLIITKKSGNKNKPRSKKTRKKNTHK